MNLVLVAIVVTLFVSAGAFVVTLAGLRWQVAAVITTVTVAFFYLATVLGVGIWASQCWRCQVPTGGDSREISFRITAVYYGVAATMLIATTWFASWGAWCLRNSLSSKTRAQ